MAISKLWPPCAPVSASAAFQPRSCKSAHRFHHQPSALRIAWLASIGLFLIALATVLFHTENHTADAFFNAYSLQFKADIFQAHHLLFTPTLIGLHQIANFFYPSHALVFGTVFSAILGKGCIILVYAIIRLYRPNLPALVLSMLVASTFGFLRFATEFETYVIPLFYSLSGLLICLAFPRSKLAFLLGSLLFAFAILLHQVQLLFSLAFLISIASFRFGYSSQRAAVVFCAAHLLVPAAYLAIAYLSQTPLLTLLLGEFATGGAKDPFSSHTILLFGISFIRTFVQVHGYFSPLWHTYPIPVAAIGVFSIAFCLVACIGFFRTIPSMPAAAHNPLKRFGLLLSAFLLAFSLLSQGNAEFLVALPFALAFALAGIDMAVAKPVVQLATGLAIWNIGLGLIPASRLVLQPYQQQADFLIASTRPNSQVFLSHKLEVDWAYAAQVGRKPANTFHLQHIASDSSGQYTYFGHPFQPRANLYFEQATTPTTSRESFTAFALQSKSLPILKQKPSQRYQFGMLGGLSEFWLYSH